MRHKNWKKWLLIRAYIVLCVGAGHAFIPSAHASGLQHDAAASATMVSSQLPPQLQPQSQPESQPKLQSQLQPLVRAPIDSGDLASLQNGARHYLQSCIACHSASHVSYARLQDIGITPEDLRAWLPDNPPQARAALLSPLDVQQGAEWFGIAPPDLSLITRARATNEYSGSDYVYSYLRGFYRDPTTRTGWNNTVAPGTLMPHVLSALQMDASDTPPNEGQAQNPKDGQLSPAEYDKALADITHFMQWMAEPGRQARKKTAGWVCLFLVAFSFAAWRLHASYWIDVE